MTTSQADFLQGEYVADPVHSTLGFAVRYQGVSMYRGTLDAGNITLKDGRLEGTAPVDSISIRTPQGFRDYVLGPEFFDAANHPDLRFSAATVTLRPDGSAAVEGELTIKGVTRPVTATGIWTAPAADAFGNVRGHLQLEAVVDRTDFGILWEVRLPSGGKALNDEVTLTVDLSLTEAS